MNEKQKNFKLTLDDRRVKLPLLKKELPHFSWKAERRGWGNWVYHGEFEDRKVLVDARGHLGEFEECYVRWYVTENNIVKDFYSFVMEEQGNIKDNK